MKEKTLEELKEERQVLTEKLLLASREKDDAAFAVVCNEAVKHFFASIRLVMNPVPEPLAFLAIFALKGFSQKIAESAAGAEENATLYAQCVGIGSTTIKMPRFKRKEDDEDGTTDL